MCIIFSCLSTTGISSMKEVKACITKLAGHIKNLEGVTGDPDATDTAQHHNWCRVQDWTQCSGYDAALARTSYDDVVHFLFGKLHKINMTVTSVGDRNVQARKFCHLDWFIKYRHTCRYTVLVPFEIEFGLGTLMPVQANQLYWWQPISQLMTWFARWSNSDWKDISYCLTKRLL